MWWVILIARLKKCRITWEITFWVIISGIILIMLTKMRWLALKWVAPFPRHVMNCRSEEREPSTSMCAFVVLPYDCGWTMSSSVTLLPPCPTMTDCTMKLWSKQNEQTLSPLNCFRQSILSPVQKRNWDRYISTKKRNMLIVNRTTLEYIY